MGLIECPTCGRVLKSLGYMRHRTAHAESVLTWRQANNLAVNLKYHAGVTTKNQLRNVILINEATRDLTPNDQERATNQVWQRIKALNSKN